MSVSGLKKKSVSIAGNKGLMGSDVKQMSRVDDFCLMERSKSDCLSLNKSYYLGASHWLHDVIYYNF